MSSSDREPFWFRHPFIAGSIVVVALFLCGWAGWAIKVAMSPVKGTGDVIIKNQDADNRIRSQAKFEDLYNDIIAKDKNLDILAATALAHPNDRIAQENLNGARMICNSTVADYNAEARKITSQDWMSKDLPHQIDGTDPSTDCKESGAR
jgi:hypothetical protein